MKHQLRSYHLHRFWTLLMHLCKSLQPDTNKLQETMSRSELTAIQLSRVSVMCSSKSVRPCTINIFSEEFQSMWLYGYSLHNFFVVSEDVETAALGEWLWLLMSWMCAAQKDLFSLSISYSLGACSVCWARAYALWIWIGCSGNNLLYFSVVNQPHSQKGWEGEMCARQIVRPTDILSPDGKMGIFSFSPALTDLLPNRLIKLTMTGLFLWIVSEPFCMKNQDFFPFHNLCWHQISETFSHHTV